MSEIGEVRFKTSLDDKGFKRGLSSCLKGADQLKSAFKTVGAVVAGALSVKALVSFGSSCLELGSNLSEVQNVVDTVFPSMNEQINAWSKNAMKQYGLSETYAKNYTSTLGAMSKAYGYSEQEAYAQATTLTGLVGDMASFYNKSTDETFNAVKAIYSGETEVLKAYGIVMTETALNEYAMQQGISKTVSAMSEQEKVSLRLAFVQDRMAMAQGDFAKTSDSWANQTRVLSLSWEQFKATIGQGLINVLTPVVSWLNSIMSAAMGAAQAFASFTASLMGISAVIGGGGAGAMASSMASVAESAEATNKSIGGAGGGAKKLKGILAGFDKLNVLNSNSGGGGGGGGGGAPISLPTIDPKPFDSGIQQAMSGVAEKAKAYLMPFVESFREAFGAIDWDNLKTKFGELVEALKPLGSKLGEGLFWFWDQVLVPVAAWTIGEVLPRFITTITIGLTFLNTILDALKPIWDWFWEDVLKPIAEWAADAFLDAWDAINRTLKKFSDWCSKNTKTIRNTIIVIGAFIAAWEVAKLLDFITCCGGITGALITVGYQLISGTGLLTAWNGVCTIASGVTSVLAGAMTFLTSPIGLVVLAILALIAVITALILNWDKVKEALLKGWEAIKKVFSTVGEFFRSVFQAGFDGIKAVFSAVGSWASGVWSSITGAFSNVVGFFGEKFRSAWDAIKNAFSSVGAWAAGLWGDIVARFTDIGVKIGDSVAGAFKTVVNGVLKTIENVINGGIDFINSAISGINSLLGLSLGKVSKLSLPRLAQGGFVEANTPQLAVIGDNRHEGEIVAPESKISEAVAQGMAGLVPAIASAVANAVKGLNVNSNNDRPFVIELDGSVIYSTVKEYESNANSRSGGRA